MKVTEMKSLKITDATKKALDKLKIHPRQSYDEVIKQIIEKTKRELNGEKSPDASNSHLQNERR